MGKVQEREREGHRVSHGAGHSSRYGAGSGAASRACRAGSGHWHSGVCSENRKQEAKLWKPRWKGIFARLKTIYFLVFSSLSMGGVDEEPWPMVPGGSLPASALQAARAAKRRCVCVRFGTDNSQRTTCTQGRRCLTGVFPFSPVTCTHTTQKPLGKDQRLAPAAAAITLHLLGEFRRRWRGTAWCCHREATSMPTFRPDFPKSAPAGALPRWAACR